MTRNHDLLGPAWRERVKKLGTAAEVAARIGVSDKTVASWTRDTDTAIPQLKNLVAIAEACQYPLLQQLVDAGLVEPRLAPYAKVPKSESLTLAVKTLWHAVEMLNIARPGPAELAKEVLAACEADGVPGRWRCRLFDVPSGRRYPHVAYRGVEFQLGPDAEGQLPAHWGRAEWDERRIDPLATAPSPWIEQCIASDGSSDPTPEFGWQRLELLYRLREKLPLVPGQWFGDSGRLHDTLLLHRDGRNRRHLYVVRAYQEQPPDPLRRVIPPYVAKNDIRRIVVIGPLALAPDSIARILAEGMAWHGMTGRELAARYSGRVRGHHDPERVTSFRHMYDYLAREGDDASYEIIGLHDLDTMVGSDGALQSEVKAMLTARRTLAIVLCPTRITLDRWHQRQLDRVSSAARVRNFVPGDMNGTFAILESISAFLKRNTTHERNWPRWTVRVDLPWFDPDKPVFEDPDIGDYRIRAAYQLAYQLKRQRPLTDGTRRASIDLADGSLLQRMQLSLCEDPDARVLEKGANTR